MERPLMPSRGGATGSLPPPASPFLSRVEDTESAREFGKPEARRHNVRTIINWARDIFNGEVTLVPIYTSQYKERIDPYVEASGDRWSMDEFVVRNALKGQPLSMERAEWYGSVPAAREPGRQWRRGIVRKVANLLEG